MFEGDVMNPIFKLYAIVIIISTFEVLFTAYIKSPTRLGRSFERRITKRLRLLGGSDIYGKVLRNVYLPKNEYETSEIDVLFITTVGVFVIECKNYNGWIFGSENGWKWTVTLPSGKRRSRKYKFYNPMKQNLSHIRPLKDVLQTEFPSRAINAYPIVVFSVRGTFKDVPKYSSQPVVHTDGMVSYIKDVTKNNNPVLTQIQVDELYEKMSVYTKASKEIKKQHKENVKKIKN